MSNSIEIAETKISNSEKLTLIAGLNVLEDEKHTFEVAEKLKNIIEPRGNGFIFKASFDKANRSSIDSYRGPGLEKGIEIFRGLKKSGFKIYEGKSDLKFLYSKLRVNPIKTSAYGSL